ncbi:MAG: hypothetical protein WD400_01415 [Pontimonas sp.]
MLNQKGGPLAVIVASELIPSIEVDPASVTPGVIGFVATFLVAIAALALMLDLVRRVRRVRYREEISERLDREEALQRLDLQASEGGSFEDGSSPPAKAEDSQQ